MHTLIYGPGVHIHGRHQTVGNLHMALTCHSEEVLAGIQETWLPPGHSASEHQDSTFHQDSYQSWQQSLRTELAAVCLW